MNFLRALLLISLAVLLNSVGSLEPQSLWITINATLISGKLMKSVCTRIILYNTPTQIYINANFSGSYIPINIEGEEFTSPATLEKVHSAVNATIMKAVSKRMLHCILVISMVNTTSQGRGQWSELEEGSQRAKLRYNIEMTKLLQFSSPVKQRFLVLIRFGNNETNFGGCKRSDVYLQYPKRTVPLWEQVLLDFFPFAWAINVRSMDKWVMTRREESNLLWMCDDIIERIEKNDECERNETLGCIQQRNNGSFSTVNFNISDCRGFTPHM